MTRRPNRTLASLLLAGALALTACGDDDDEPSPVTEPAGATEDSMVDDSMVEDSMVEDSMVDDSMVDTTTAP